MNIRKVKQSLANNKLRIVEAVCLIIALVIVITAAVTITYQRFTLTGTYRNEFSGRIIDKVTRYHESDEGSSRERHLIIEDRGGKRSEVYVTEDIYGRANIGMWIEKSDKGVNLVPPK